MSSTTTYVYKQESGVQNIGLLPHVAIEKLKMSNIAIIRIPGLCFCRSKLLQESNIHSNCLHGRQGGGGETRWGRGAGGEGVALQTIGTDIFLSWSSLGRQKKSMGFFYCNISITACSANC